MAQDIDVMLVNELRRLDRAIDSRRALLDSLNKKRTRVFPQRYVLEFSFPLTDTPAALTKSFLVAQNAALFRLEKVGQAVIAAGTASPEEETIAARFACLIEENASFEFQIQDSNSDRAWSNTFLPSPFISTSILEPSILPDGLALPGGTEVSMTVRPTTALPATYANLTDITEFTYQIVFSGQEVVYVDNG